MRRWGIRKKVLVVTLIPTLTTTLMLGIFFTVSWVNNIEASLTERGESLSRQLSAGSEYALFAGNRSLLNGLSGSFLEEQDVRAVTFYDAEGRRLMHSGPGNPENLTDNTRPLGDPVHVERPAGSVFIAPVLLKDLFMETMLDPEAQDQFGRSETAMGWVAVEMSRIRTDKETYKALLISLLVVLAGVLLSIAIALRLSRAFISPVFQLNEAVARLKEGKLETRVYTDAGPEFEQLESGLNAMAEALSNAQAEMQQNIDQATEDLRETLETIEIQNIELDFARKEALEASRVKSEFLANMSHEIRTPLNGIIGFTDLLLKSPLPRQQRDHLNTIRKSSEILLTIINDILDFSKIEAGKLSLDHIPFQLREIVEEVMTMLAPAAHSKNLDLVPLIYQDVPDGVLGDPLRIKQVITNLVNNAIKFTQTGEVVLRVSLEEENTSSQQVTLRISITDSGVGLSRAQQQSLFNAFSQADASTARQYGGTGLGLAISKRLVEEMGGEIGLESELGKGSTFWFTLTTTKSTSSDTPAPKDNLRGERVIYLESQPTTGLAVTHMLRDWGMTVDTVASPEALQETVETAQKDQAGYALALIGINRHLFNSNQYRRLINTLELDLDCRTLLLTPTNESHEAPLSGLASGHLTKPLSRDSLYNELSLLVHGVNPSQNALPAQRPATADKSSDAKSPRVLAVDDNDANLKLVMTLLKDCGIQAEAASSGFEAISKARQGQFDLVFMDLQMPGMDGVETTERLRELDGSGHHTPVIALTAHALADERDRLSRQGFDGYLGKPISTPQLAEIIFDMTGFSCSMEEGSGQQPAIRDTRRMIRPSARRRQGDCVSIEESIQLAAGKKDLAEELFSMLVEQVHAVINDIPALWQAGEQEAVLETVHKLHGATRYCGVPELRSAVSQLETALKTGDEETNELLNHCVRAMENLLEWSEQTDWQDQFRTFGDQPAISE